MTAPTKDASTSWELPETHIERMDRLEFERETELAKLKIAQTEETKRSKHRRSEARQDTLQIVGIAFVVGVVILGIVAAIYYGTRGPDGPNGISEEERREIACVANGGGFVPEDILESSASHGICVFPGKTPVVPGE